jgi:hypothetical protein
MKQSLNIDRTFRERRRISRLLDFLKREALTRDQLERIGRRLQKSGRRALPPLVRRIWREIDRERLYRYTCMLDFFDASAWLDQLVSLTIKRRDLPEEGRLPLLEILQDYGVDVSAPPFSATDSASLSINGFLDICLTDEQWGMVRFMDRFLDADEQLRIRLIRGLSQRIDHGPMAAAHLEMMSSFEYPEYASAAVEALGALRHGAALNVLYRLQKMPLSNELLQLVKRGVKRLGFLGVREASPLPAMVSEPKTLVTVQTSPVDCYGVRTLWFSWLLSNEVIPVLLLQIKEADGVLHGVRYNLQNMNEHQEYLEELQAQEGLFAVSMEYASKLLRDAINSSIEGNFYMPPDLYAARYLFGNTELGPEQYLPSFPLELLETLVERMPELLLCSDKLVELPSFEGWIFSDNAVYDIAAEQLKDPVAMASAGDGRDNDPYLEEFCQLVIEPERGPILRRLILVADSMLNGGGDEELVQQVLAVGMSLVSSSQPLHRHPFIRRIAIESLDFARQALSEGYDPRNELSEIEEW